MEKKTDKNYLPLFRKYRPQTFSDVVGQESLVKALSNAIELNRIAQAYLFCGPRGTGKTSCARIFAKSLNCKEGPTLNPCQKCASCTDITNATGLDVIEIDAASNRGIQDAKELISQVQYAPINGKYKIFIIDEVHMLSTDAFNALLKTFEEPPENVIFILATTEPHKVLETIVSRCQRFDLRRITTDDIIKRLKEISAKENIKITDDALFTIAKNVSGGLRDSLALLDQVSILGVKDEITKDLIEELLGKINFDVLLNLLKNIYSQDVAKSLFLVDEIYSKGNEPRNLTENLIEFLRNVILILNSSDDENIIKLTCLVKEDIENVRNSGFDKDKITKILNTVIEYYKEIKISTNPYLWAELSVIACCRLDLQNSATIERKEIKNINALQSKEAKLQTKPVQKEQTEPIQQTPSDEAENIEQSAPVSNVTLDPARIWSSVISSISSLPSRAFFSGVAKLVGIENNKIIIGFLYDNLLNQAKSETKINQLKTAISLVCPDMDFEFIKINENTKVIEVNLKQSQKPKTQYQAQTEVPKDLPVQNPIESPEVQDGEKENTKPKNKDYSPQVQDMIEQFSGRIIE